MKKTKQRISFLKHRRNFWLHYKKIQNLGKEPFILPFWAEVNKELEKAFLPLPPFDFLCHTLIKSTMFVGSNEDWIQNELKLLRKVKGLNLASLTKEDTPGKPELLKRGDLLTSANSIHHLYHVYRFQKETAVKLESINSVVEWGGGYGNQAKLWQRLRENESTYTIIDTALFCAIQWLYLTSILGPKTVHLLSRRGDKIKQGSINLVPLALLDKTSIKADLFVSTWGLSESMASAQDYVINMRKWFGASRLLIGFQDSTSDLKHASRLGALSQKNGAKIIDIAFIPNNHYAFK